MQFTSAADQYDRFMGRYSSSLAGPFADAAGITEGMRVLDVGCGPGAVTQELVRRTGAANVAAIDPAPQFAAACRERYPGADVRVGAAEELPWEDGAFDATVSSLVVGFMRDADQGLREMARVTRPGGTVAACMWDIAGNGMAMLNAFWAAARSLDPGVRGESSRPGTAEGDLGERFRRVGLADVVEGHLEARADYTDFDDFWEPFTFAVGPAGQFLASLDADGRARLRAELARTMPDEPFTLTARAWLARGTVSPG